MLLNCFHYPSPPLSGRKNLILLHGLGGTGSLWRPLAATLEEELNLLCPDQRGHGRSRPSSEDWSFAPEDFARDLVETARHHSFQPAWVLGHSMGVRSAVGYAKLAPESVDGLILIDLGFSGLAGGGVGDALADFLQILPEQFSSRTEAREFMNQHCPDSSIGQYLIAVSQIGPQGQITFPFSHDALRRTVEQARGTETFEKLTDFAKNTGKPVNILRGARSQVYSRKDFEADRSRSSPFPHIHFHEVEGAGHGLPFEKRAELIEMIRSWMKLET